MAINWPRFVEIVESHQRFLLTSHIRPDCDALGSELGMAGVEECFRDGHSTAGSAGTGLGAVRRLASFLDVYSIRPGGTVIVAQVAAPDASPPAAAGWDVGAVWQPKAGEDVCGDAWAATETRDGYSLVMADGLGHGLGAADAARAAVRCFEAAPGGRPAGSGPARPRSATSLRSCASPSALVDKKAEVSHVWIMSSSSNLKSRCLQGEMRGIGDSST